MRKSSIESLWQPQLIREAFVGAFRKLHPKDQFQNPVIFVVTLGALITTGLNANDAWNHQNSPFDVQICLWLWGTVLFANFAEAFAEGRGKAQADALKGSRKDIRARKKIKNGEVSISANELQLDDLVICEAGEPIPGDGEVVEGVASVDESAITGESAPVIRECGGDRSAVTGGTRVLSDRIVIRITAKPGESFMDRMIHLVEGAKRQRTPNEIALSILLFCLTAVFLVVVATLWPLIRFSELQTAHVVTATPISLSILIALLVCLIPTTIGGLLSAIGISGMNRLLRKNVLAMSGRAVEAAGDIDVLLLDKTGTITLGNRMASEFLPLNGVQRDDLIRCAQLASLADETPEGRSIINLAKEEFGLRPWNDENFRNLKPIPFSGLTRMSGADFEGQRFRKGAVDAVRKWTEDLGGVFPQEAATIAKEVARSGATPLAVALDQAVLGIIVLKDVVKGGIRERFQQLRRMGIRTVMITGDNPITAASIAAEAGVDDFLSEATPEMKLRRIREEQSAGHLVAMAGDGTNDAPALAQADVGVAMNTGTQAAREAGNMVDLDSNPTKIIEIVETGKQILMTRGALTSFSIANDVAKYFAILPALFAHLYISETGAAPLASLNIMRLHSPQSAVLSATIFNALIIVALIPLAIRGIAYRPLGAVALLRRNLWIYGVGGLLTPFLGIKVIDWTLTVLGFA